MFNKHRSKIKRRQKASPQQLKAAAWHTSKPYTAEAVAASIGPMNLKIFGIILGMFHSAKSGTTKVIDRRKPPHRDMSTFARSADYRLRSHCTRYCLHALHWYIWDDIGSDSPCQTWPYSSKRTHEQNAGSNPKSSPRLAREAKIWGNSVWATWSLAGVSSEFVFMNRFWVEPILKANAA